MQKYNTDIKAVNSLTFPPEHSIISKQNKYIKFSFSILCVDLTDMMSISFYSILLLLTKDQNF